MDPAPPPPPLPAPRDLAALAAAHRDAYLTAEPFPHVVLDGVFDPAVLRGVLAEFPGPAEGAWKEYDDAQQVKRQSTDEARWGPRSREFFRALNSQVFLRFLEDLTGIPALIPDPDYWGGGFHQIHRGGHLKIHADFNRHPVTGLDRRLNVLVYLNEDWPESYGGHFELWDQRMEACGRRVLPRFNRLVVFSTTSTSYHGHPDPVTCPPDRSRRSLAMYYYTNGRPLAEYAHGMLSHGTLFQRRPGEPPGVLDGAERAGDPSWLGRFKRLVPLWVLVGMNKAKWVLGAARREARPAPRPPADPE